MSGARAGTLTIEVVTEVGSRVGHAAIAVHDGFHTTVDGQRVLGAIVPNIRRQPEHSIV